MAATIGEPKPLSGTRLVSFPSSPERRLESPLEHLAEIHLNRLVELVSDDQTLVTELRPAAVIRPARVRALGTAKFAEDEAAEAFRLPRRKIAGSESIGERAGEDMKRPRLRRSWLVPTTTS
jgi:hypothetical protein